MQNQNNKKNDAANLDSDKNRFMINWGEDAPPEYYSGDEQTDDFNIDNDYNENLDLRMSTPMGGTFMHPMHDATLDSYDNEAGFETKKLNKEKK